MEDPMDVEDARRAAHLMAVKRREAEAAYEAQIDKAAAAEAEYRKAYARAFVSAEGTAAEREAVAKAEAASKGYDRDLAAGLVRALSERLRGLEGERSILKSLIDFSARLQIDGRERVAA